jgi:S1-C subfamily serine protease
MNCFFGKSMLTFCALSIVSFTASALGEDEHSVAGLKGQFPASSDEKIASGSGVLIGPQTVLTNRHIVMDDSDRAYHGFRVSTGPKYETSDSVRARAVFVSEDYDLAILELETPRGNPRIQILDDVAPLGTKISAFGFPLGSSVGIGLTLTGGQIGRLPVPWQPSDTNEEKSIKKALWHDAVIASGSSGGPIFSERGVLVGLNYAFLKKSSHALSVPGSAIASFLRSTKCNTEITLITNGSLPTTTPSSDIQNNVVYVEVFGEDRKQPIMNDLSMEVLGLKDTVLSNFKCKFGR